MKHPSDDEIQDLVDGVLPGTRADSLREHIAYCARCSEEVRGIEALKELATGLWVGAAPPKGEWERIEARIVENTRPLVGDRRIDFPRAATPRFPLRRVAGWILVAVGVGAGAVAVGSRSGPVPANESALPDSTFPEPSGAIADAYAQSVYDLEVIFAAGAEQLAPETLAVIEENLRVIEDAVERARTEIAADPGSVALARSLNSLYGAKVRVLSTAVALADER